jgi:hypothetical protein
MILTAKRFGDFRDRSSNPFLGKAFGDFSLFRNKSINHMLMDDKERQHLHEDHILQEWMCEHCSKDELQHLDYWELQFRILASYSVDTLVVHEYSY